MYCARTNSTYASVMRTGNLNGNIFQENYSSLIFFCVLLLCFHIFAGVNCVAISNVAVASTMPSEPIYMIHAWWLFNSFGTLNIVFLCNVIVFVCGCASVTTLDGTQYTTSIQRSITLALFTVTYCSKALFPFRYSLFPIIIMAHPFEFSPCCFISWHWWEN